METSKPIKTISLPFSPWRHQIPTFEAFEEKGYKRLFLVHHRRAGKDVLSFNLVFREALRKPGTYVYMLPTIDQARKVIWNSRQNSGERFVEGYIPKELILKTHEQDMRVELVNGSVIQLAGSDNYNRLMGINAWGLVFSEWSLSDPAAWDYLQPIVQLNGGWALFQGTPRGQNHFYDMWLKAKENPKTWFTQIQTIKDTGLISEQEIADAIARGDISYEKAQQEYYCSFLSLNEQTYYGRYVDDMRLRGRIGDFPWDPSYPVHAGFDWGHRDQTVAIFFQLIQGTVRIIDCQAKTGEGLEFYAKYMKDKPYTYGTLIGPHDMRVHELTTNQTRWAKMHSLGYTFQIAPHVPVQDGIESCRTILPRTYINAKEGHCSDLVKALENYRAERVTVHGTALSKPKHDSYSDFCDSWRYCCLMIPHIRTDSISPEKLNAMRMTAKYGSPSLSPFFR